ncbi:MAG: GNAT family N-acetyltransferase [Acidobacteriota bacterium]
MRLQPDRAAATMYAGREAVHACLATAWRDALARAHAPHVFHLPAVQMAWLDTIGRLREVEPLVVRVAHGGVEAWFSVAIHTYRGRLVSRRVCEAVGQDYFGYDEPLVVGDPATADWDAVWSALRAALAGTADSGLFRSVDPRLAGTRFSEPAGDESPVLRLEGESFDRLLARCSANHRGDIRRRVRRLEQRGDLALHIFGPAEAPAAVAELAGPFWAAFTDPGGSHAGQERPGLRDFVTRLVQDGVPAGHTHVSALRLDGRAIAWHVGLQSERRLYWWLPAHAEAWAEYSPGKVLLARLIERLMGDGWAELHFQTGSQRYKLAWQPTLPPRRAVRWYARTARAGLLAAYDRLSGLHAR